MKLLILRIVCFYLRNTSIGKGKFRLLRYARSTLRKIGKSIGTTTLLTRHGFSMKLDLKDWVPQDIYLTGEFERTTTAIVKKTLTSGDHVVDIGANIGYYSLLFAKCIGKTGVVYAFEPVPDIASKLKHNIELNRYDQIEIRDTALSDHNGIAQFYTGPASNSGTSSLRKLKDYSDIIDVDLKRFDDVFKSDKPVLLIKIDVEGAEMSVVRGMEKYLKEVTPDLIIEMTDKFLNQFGDTESNLIKFLENIGYQAYEIGDGKISLIDEKTQLPSQWNAYFTTK